MTGKSAESKKLDRRFFYPKTLRQTEELARKLALLLPPPVFIALKGPMGAGKTAFARAFIRARSENADLAVPSPTFSLTQTYPAPCGPVFHYDLWRLADPDELEELGWEEALEHTVLAEWPEKAGRRLPAERLELIFSMAEGEKGRRVKLISTLAPEAFNPAHIPELSCGAGAD